ncbi:UNVERIFIED_CONTAM: hypothetical protein PYX00_005068 [Menopon gallinae]|uniref:SAP domain-containing protein n=1 Tax=Menopon gallinae TaxID=328185 RepID=A0AAW2HQ15_9NEOP
MPDEGGLSASDNFRLVEFLRTNGSFRSSADVAGCRSALLPLFSSVEDRLRAAHSPTGPFRSLRSPRRRSKAPGRSGAFSGEDGEPVSLLPENVRRLLRCRKREPLPGEGERADGIPTSTDFDVGLLSTFPSLKEELQKRSLKTSGHKARLQDGLLMAVALESEREQGEDECQESDEGDSDEDRDFGDGSIPHSCCSLRRVNVAFVG